MEYIEKPGEVSKGEEPNDLNPERGLMEPTKGKD